MSSNNNQSHYNIPDPSGNVAKFSKLLQSVILAMPETMSSAEIQTAWKIGCEGLVSDETNSHKLSVTKDNSPSTKSPASACTSDPDDDTPLSELYPKKNGNQKSTGPSQLGKRKSGDGANVNRAEIVSANSTAGATVAAQTAAAMALYSFMTDSEKTQLVEMVTDAKLQIIRDVIEDGREGPLGVRSTERLTEKLAEIQAKEGSYVIPIDDKLDADSKKILEAANDILGRMGKPFFYYPQGAHDSAFENRVDEAVKEREIEVKENIRKSWTNVFVEPVHPWPETQAIGPQYLGEWGDY